MTDEELEQLLPWYVNGTLDEAETAAVAALLERSASAREEVAFLRALSERIADESAPAPSELGWQRLRRQLAPAAPSAAQRWWKPGIAAAAAVIMALQVMIVSKQPEPYDADLLGSQPSQVMPNQSVVQLRFADDRDWSELMILLRELDGRIIDGPSSIGLLRIQLNRDHSRFASEAELLDWLQQQTGVTHVAIEKF